jgi:glycine betaine/choline ABC-type transport system substrate-binding protein
MKRAVLSVILLSILVLCQSAPACVGRTLSIGIIESPSDILFAEMVSVLVNERTGTSVKVVPFKEASDLYSAVKKGDIGMVIETPGRALKMLGRPAADPKAGYEAARKEFRTTLDLVWLEPFGGSQYYAPVLSMDTVGKLPALPKLINKLGGQVNDETCARLLKAAKSEEKPRKVAREFLKSKKLI